MRPWLITRAGRSPVGVVALALGCLALAACADRDDDTARVVVTGSSTVAPLMADIAARYEAETPGARVDVQTGGSSRGLADVRQGLADLGMVSRAPKDGEDDLTWTPIARDGLALIVHAERPLTSLDEDQVRAVFTGAIEQWSLLGGDQTSPGADGPITVVSKAEGRSTLEVFLDHFGLASSDLVADVVIGDNQQGIKTVAGDPHAIAYVSIGSAEAEVALGTPIRLLALGGVAASSDTVRDGTYPVARTLHVVSLGEPTGAAGDFLRYALSPAVDDLVEGQFFVPLSR